jgi:ABC-type glycerol-3-phosphate transport system substrate-binding protein
MREYIRASRPTLRLRSALSMLTLAALAACGGESRTDTAAANASADSATGRDLAMAPRDSVQPELQDVPAPPPPPAPVEAAPAPPLHLRYPRVL